MKTKANRQAGVSLPLVVASLAVVAMAIGLAFHLRTESSGTLAETDVIVTEKPNTPSTFPEEDTDGDGLKDWEETLWNTDIKNPDTDGDGTSDGNEVLVSRDPLTAGPDDALGASIVFPGTTQTSNFEQSQSPEELTATAQLARDIFTSYTSLKQFGELDVETIENLAASALATNVPDIPNIQPYTLSDLSFVPASAQTLTDYQAELEFILFRPDSKLENELVVFTELLENSEDTSGLETLYTIRDRYGESEQELLAMQVPETIAAQHLTITNVAASLKVNTTLLLDALEDPVLSVSAVKNYENALSDAQNAFITLNTIFASEGIATLEAS